MWTIGYGNTRYQDGTAVKNGDTITKAGADDLFAYWVDQSVSFKASGDTFNLSTKKYYKSTPNM